MSRHLAKVEEVLKRLKKAGMKVNLHKSELVKDNLDYLGYTLTNKGIIPQCKKVKAILRILPPKNKKQLRHVLGMINYYHDMWKQRSHILAPLAELASKKSNFK